MVMVEIKRRLLLGIKVMTNLDSLLKSRDIALPTKVHLVKTGFSSSQVRMWELDCKESWALKNWCFWTVVLEKTLESPLDSKPVHPKGNQPWLLIVRTGAETEAPILWPPDAKSQLTGKDHDAGKNWREEERGTTEHEMAGWHHWLDRHSWASSGNWRWTEKPGVLQSMVSQRVGHDWATERNWTDEDLSVCILGL